MPIDSSVVGQELPSSVEDLSVRRVLAYAAGLADTSPAVFDDLAGDLAAPPPFCVSLEWPVVSHPEIRERLGAAPDELLRGVHASQDSVFHRAMRPGMRLTTRGTMVGMRQTRAGTLATTRLDTEAEDGPVVSSWQMTMYRGVELEGGDRELESGPALPEPASSPAPEYSRIRIARELPHVYTECAQIWNPIHTERAVARAAGLPDIILHGTATWALAGREIVARHAAGDPTRLRRLRGSFRAMVIPGSEIEVEHSASDAPGGQTIVSFRVRNAEGEEAVADGWAVISREGG
ncbi:MAG: hypothetical protein CL910_06480 [Deltaproteobacteria bacterium]|jgi:acyl dehydratase|nr:hypothetical protein [Deltaproteobacteria bacterium]